MKSKNDYVISATNDKLLNTWKRQPEIDRLKAQRMSLQREFDSLVGGDYTEKKAKRAEELRSQIAGLNKSIAVKSSRTEVSE
jgi:cell division protein FtsB